MTQEEKAKAYDRVSKEAKDFFEGRQKMYSDVEQTLEYLFPELKESEDEKVRKELITHCRNTRCVTEEGAEKIAKWIDWLKKQDTERKQLYVRFGDIPSNEKSKIYHGEEEIGDENGVSVYPAFELNGNIVLGLTLPITKTTLYTQQHLLEYDNRPCYLVSGDYVGKGTDGEPLIRNISIIKRLDNYRIKELEKQSEEKSTLPKWKYKKDHTPLLNDSIILNKYGCVAKSPSGAIVSDVWVLDYSELAKLPKEEIENQDEQKAAIEMISAEESLGIDSETYKKIVDECIYGDDKQKLAWGEEDECYMSECIGAIATKDGWSFEEKRKTKHWLKSLKDKYTWKPSEEQIKAVKRASNGSRAIAGNDYLIMEALYNDLKKLKGE